MAAVAQAKVVALFAELGQFDKIAQYCAQVQYAADWPLLLQLVMSRNPAAALPFAQMLLAPQPAGPALADVNTIVDIFVQRGLIKEATSILFDVVKASGDRPEMAAIQTRLLEINLATGHAPVVDALLGSQTMTQFDKPRIARLCEQAGLYQRALELYTEYADRRRVMLQTHAINPQWLCDYFANLLPEQALEVLTEMMATNARQNLPVVVEVAAKFSDAFGSANLIALFENHRSTEGLFRYLQRVVNFSTDPAVHLKYIKSAALLGQTAEVERIVRESSLYDAEAVRDFLMEQKLPDQLPLVIVCDRFGYVDKLTQYLYQNGQSQFIEAYVQQINPANTPAVIGALLDCDCNEDYVANLILAVGPKAPAAELIHEAERRNRLKLLQHWLEARVSEGNQEEAVHNALAKIFIDLNREPKEFLINNQYYNSKVVGQYCEHRDPFLAYVAYRRGLCDDELIALTNTQGLFKDQARYLVERQDAALWARVLVDANVHKRSVIDQVVQTALPESGNSEEVSTTVKAFMTADLPNELIELLEKIVLESSQFSGNRNLQNLLILTAIKAAKERVMDYVTRLEGYDAQDIAQIAIGAGLFEEAFTVYRKFKHHEAAIQVLIEHIKDLERASEFAMRVNEGKRSMCILLSFCSSTVLKRRLRSSRVLEARARAARQWLGEGGAGVVHQGRRSEPLSRRDSHRQQGRPARGADCVSANGAQEDQEPDRGERARVRVRQDEQLGGVGGVHQQRQLGQHSGRGRPLLRGGPARGGAHSVHEHQQLCAPGVDVGEAGPVRAGRGRGAQGQLAAHVEGGVLRVREPQGVPPGANCRSGDCGACRSLGGSDSPL